MLIERYLNNEKILTLIYDKTFYSDVKNIDINFNNDEFNKSLNEQW